MPAACHLILSCEGYAAGGVVVHQWWTGGGHGMVVTGDGEWADMEWVIPAVTGSNVTQHCRIS